jgi:hypothetical protein
MTPSCNHIDDQCFKSLGFHSASHIIDSWDWKMGALLLRMNVVVVGLQAPSFLNQLQNHTRDIDMCGIFLLDFG